MNAKDIQRYFDRRPSAEELYVVGGIVFTTLDQAKAYANQMGLTVETKRRDEQDETAVSAPQRETITASIGKKKGTSKKALK